MINTSPLNGAVRSGKWKLVRKAGEEDLDNPQAAKAGAESIELFDLSTDSGEKINLAEQHPEKVTELKAVLAKYASEAVAPKSRPKPRNYHSPAVWGE